MRCVELMDETAEPNNALEAAPSAVVQWVDSDPVIEFDHVDFGYGDGDGADGLVLRDIDLRANRGERQKRRTHLFAW